MMDRMPSPLLSEWIAFYGLQDEESKRDYLAKKAAAAAERRRR